MEAHAAAPRERSWTEWPLGRSGRPFPILTSFLPAMPALLNQPFWLDPSDPHRMAGVMQISSRAPFVDHRLPSGDWRYSVVSTERIWAKAVHRVVADGLTPEQAVDEAIARSKEILAE